MYGLKQIKSSNSNLPFIPPTASFSELLLLALAIGGAITGVVLLLIIIVSCRRCQMKRQKQLCRGNLEEAPRKERKDPTAW